MKLLTLFILPLRDFWRGYERILLKRGVKGFLGVLVGLVIGWWVYVPLHELLHAYGCIFAGGTVTRLEIDEMYGGALLARIFPFVHAGSDYAGQLTGFGPRYGFVYLATVMAPFVLTVFPGVWALRRFGERGTAFGFGLVLPLAVAPVFPSIIGDAYEIGSILVTQIPPWSGEELRGLLRGDDVFLKAEQLQESALKPFGGYALACVTGALWAFGTYGLGAGLARLLSRGERAAQETSSS